jgi:fatty acid desaturase
MLMSAGSVPPADLRVRYRSECRALNAISPLKVTLAIGQCWLLIALALALPMATAAVVTGQADPLAALTGPGGPAAAVLAAMLTGMIVIAARQHALLVIMHDATHFRLLASKALHDRVANWLCAFPVGLVTSLYRRGHLVHHSFTNTVRDPYYVQMKDHPHFRTPLPRRRFAGLLAGDAIGLNLPEWGDFVAPWLGWTFLLRRGDSHRLSRGERLEFAAFWLILAAGVAASGQALYLAMMWIAPSLTFLLLFARVRIVSEHTFEEQPDELKRTRHVEAYGWERFLFAPMNINYHIAHHLFPSIPFYNLPDMHAILMRDRHFADHALVYRSYFGGRDSVAAAILSAGDVAAEPAATAGGSHMN